MSLHLQLNKGVRKIHNNSNFKTEASEDETIRGEFKQFLKSHPSPKVEQSNQQNNLDTLVKKQREKLKINPISKEIKFNKKLHNFANLKTFTDISKFLLDLNVVNNALAYKESQDLKQKLDTLCRVQQFAEFRTKNQLDSFKPSIGYTTKMNFIQLKMKRSSKDENIYHSQSLQQLRDLNKIGVTYYNQNQVQHLQTSGHECENEDKFYEKVMNHLEHGSIPKKRIIENQEDQSVIENLFTINRQQEKEKQRLTQQLQALEKNVGNKLLFMDQNVKVHSKKYYETFQQKSKKIIHLLQKKQIQELQDRQEELDNIPMFTKKKTDPKKLFKLYKNKLYADGNVKPLKNQKITQRHNQKQLHHNNLIKIMNVTDTDHLLDTSQASEKFKQLIQNTDGQNDQNPLLAGAKKKFQNAFQKLIYQRTKTSGDRLRFLIRQASEEIRQNQTDNKYFNDETNRIMRKNELLLNKYEDPQVESIKFIDNTVISSTFIPKRKFRPKLI